MHPAGHSENRQPVNPWRIATWAIAALLLVAPLVAMQLTDEVNWSAMDFLVMGVMLAAVCGGIELALRISRDLAYRAACAVALVTGFLLVWINLAVGIIGDEGERANLLFFGVLLVALVGSVLTGMQPRGMARAMTATAVVQAAIGVLALVLACDIEAVFLPLLFAGGWLTSAQLFRVAAQSDAGRIGTSA